MAPRRINLSVVVLTSAALLVAGCGAGSATPSVAHLSPGTSRSGASGAGTSGDTETGAGGASPGPGSTEAAALAFASCMRANGVPSFPDPSRRRLSVSHGRRRRSFFARVQGGADEVREVPALGPRLRPAAVGKDIGAFPDGRAVHASHGVPEFPDPRTTVPSNPRAALGGRGGVISDIEGVIFVFGGRSINSHRHSHERQPRARFRCTTTDAPLSKFLASSQPILRSYLA